MPQQQRTQWSRIVKLFSFCTAFYGPKSDVFHSMQIPDRNQQITEADRRHPRIRKIFSDFRHKSFSTRKQIAVSVCKLIILQNWEKKNTRMASLFCHYLKIEQTLKIDFIFIMYVCFKGNEINRIRPVFKKRKKSFDYDWL